MKVKLFAAALLAVALSGCSDTAKAKADAEKAQAEAAKAKADAEKAKTDLELAKLNAGTDKGAQAKQDLEKMQGEWKVEKAVWHGEEEPAEKRLKRTVWFDGSTMTIREGNRVLKGEVTLDASKKPAAIDIKAREEMMLGIYKIDGDTLSLCWNELGRSATFEGSGKNRDPGLVLFVLKRGKK